MLSIIFKYIILLPMRTLIPRWERSPPDRTYSFMDMATSTVYPRAVSRLARILCLASRPVPESRRCGL